MEIHDFMPEAVFSVLSNKTVHHYIVAETSAHDKEMENFVGTKIPVAGVEKWKLHGVDDTACRIDDAAGQQPHETGFGQGA